MKWEIGMNERLRQPYLKTVNLGGNDLDACLGCGEPFNVQNPLLRRNRKLMV